LFEKELLAFQQSAQMIAYQVQELRKTMDKIALEIKRANDLKENARGSPTAS
jgi:hypothetical protein